MTTTRNHTSPRTKAVFTSLVSSRPNLEALYPREGFVRTPDGVKPIYLGHPDALCDGCERPFNNQRKHPQSDRYAGCVVICGDHLMKLTDRTA